MRRSVAPLAARKRGIYFSLLAIAFGVMFWFLVFVLDTWTGGEDGLTGLQRLSLGGIDLRGNLPLYYFVHAFLVAASILLWRIVHSPFGPHRTQRRGQDDMLHLLTGLLAPDAGQIVFKPGASRRALAGSGAQDQRHSGSVTMSICARPRIA